MSNWVPKVLIQTEHEQERLFPVCFYISFCVPNCCPHNVQQRGVHSWSELQMLLYLGIYLCTMEIGMLRYFMLWLDYMWALSCSLSATVSSQIAQLNPWLSNMCRFMISFELKHSLKTLHLCCLLLPLISCASSDLLCLQLSCHTLCTQGQGDSLCGSIWAQMYWTYVCDSAGVIPFRMFFLKSLTIESFATFIAIE